MDHITLWHIHHIIILLILLCVLRLNRMGRSSYRSSGWRRRNDNRYL